MGNQLYSIYEEAKLIGGFGAQMRLAILTMIPSVKALELPDSAENIKKFKDAMVIVKKEYKTTLEKSNFN